MVYPPGVPKTQKQAIKPAQRVNRAQAAKLLGLSTSGVRSLERSGALPFTLDATGWHWFTRADVEAAQPHVARAAPKPAESQPAKRATAGERARAAFGLLAQGQDWRDLVRALALDPDEARELARTFHTPEAVVLSRDVVDDLRTLLGGGAITGASLVAGVRRLRERLRDARARSSSSGQPRRQHSPASDQQPQERQIDQP